MIRIDQGPYDYGGDQSEAKQGNRTACVGLDGWLVVAMRRWGRVMSEEPPPNARVGGTLKPPARDSSARWRNCVEAVGTG